MLGKFLAVLVAHLGVKGAATVAAAIVIGMICLLAAGTDAESLGNTIKWLLSLAE